MTTRPDFEATHQGRQLLRSAAMAIAAGAAAGALVLAVSGGAISAQDKYTVQVRGGLAFSEFRGFEDWATVAVSQSGDLIEVDFMVRDSKRFSKTGNWGYAQFNYDAASDTFTPEGTGSDCGFSCHTIVAKKDYVFTAYGKR